MSKIALIATIALASFAPLAASASNLSIAGIEAICSAKPYIVKRDAESYTYDIPDASDPLGYYDWRIDDARRRYSMNLHRITEFTSCAEFAKNMEQMKVDPGSISEQEIVETFEFSEHTNRLNELARLVSETSRISQSLECGHADDEATCDRKQVIVLKAEQDAMMHQREIIRGELMTLDADLKQAERMLQNAHWRGRETQKEVVAQ